LPASATGQVKDESSAIPHSFARRREDCDGKKCPEARNQNACTGPNRSSVFHGAAPNQHHSTQAAISGYSAIVPVPDGLFLITHPNPLTAPRRIIQRRGVAANAKRAKDEDDNGSRQKSHGLPPRNSSRSPEVKLVNNCFTMIPSMVRRTSFRGQEYKPKHPACSLPFYI
jgi:hypothetical protein